MTDTEQTEASEENSTETTATQSISGSMVRNSLLLGLFALVTAALLSTTYTQTADRIAAAERANAQRALLEIIPIDRHNNELLDTTQPIAEAFWPQLGLKKGGEINLALQDDSPVAVIVPAVAPDGYGGDIKMIVGINTDGRIAGVRVLSHTETPGLGDKVDLNKSDWILSFNGKSLSNPEPSQWTVKKNGGEFDQFTGATITPRAVVQQVKRVLEFYELSQPLTQQAEEL